MNKTLVIGHRGSGKSSFASRLAIYLSKRHIDLDNYIEKQEKNSIISIFKNFGEEAFRKLEEKYFKEALAQADILSLGAGCKLPDSLVAEVIFIRRNSDDSGRIFLDRPRLNSTQSPLDEYFSYKKKRELYFNKICNEKLTLLEGFDFLNPVEKQWALNQISLKNWCITFNKENLKSWHKRKLWNINKWELRNDLLSDNEILNLVQTIDKDKLLISIRTKPSPIFLKQIVGFNIDWDLAIGEPDFKPYILSLHQEGLAKLLSYSKSESLLKYAVKVKSVEQLKEIHDLKERALFSFLPISESGRWKWYRLHFSGQQNINFCSDIIPSAPDQPSLLQALYRGYMNHKNFAAVIGKPVSHSLSPAAHFHYFENQKIPFYSIESDDLSEVHYFKELGLKYAAVTSPLKQQAFEMVDIKSEIATDLESVNTLYLNKELCGHNTDVDGLVKLRDSIDVPINQDTSIAVWGAGGLATSIKQVFNSAVIYSAREGKPKGSFPDSTKKPDILIWSCGRDTVEKYKAWPPVSWKPKIILDMNYLENSPGLEYAQKISSKYISGMTLFTEQAKKQQDYWRSFDSK